jgi:hypothetical protein
MLMKIVCADTASPSPRATWLKASKLKQTGLREWRPFERRY